MRNLNVLMKLMAASAVVAVIFAASILYSIVSTAAVNANYAHILQSAVPNETAAAQLDTDMWGALAEVRGAIVSGNPGSYQSFIKDAKTQIGLLKKLSVTPQQKSAYQALSADVSQELYTLGQVEMYATTGLKPEAIELLGTSTPTRNQMRTDVLSFEQQTEHVVAQTAQREQGAARTALIVEVVLAVVAMVVGFLLIRRMAAMIAEPITRIAEGARRIADGDLTSERLSDASGDELGDVAKAFNRMTEDLRQMIGRIRQAAQEVATAGDQMASTAEQVAGATAQISSSMQEVAAGASLQSQRADETAGYMDQLKLAAQQVMQGAKSQAEDIARATEVVRQSAKAIEQVARSAQEVSAAAARALHEAESGGSSVRQTVDGIAQIDEASREAVAAVEALGASSQQIGAIVEVISSIADQTNLLALNAAIEAARAGEHGRGFAVVADEVRKLAESSGEASDQISQIIETIQGHVHSAVENMNVSNERVRQGTEMAGKAGRALEAILQAMRETNGYAQDISAAAEEVAASTEGAVQAMDAIAAVAEESLAATEQMTSQAMAVQERVQGVAAVSAETAAAVAQVSSSSEEMGASAEEITATARRLADTAGSQREIVLHFRT